jgi:hypothetical protein
MACAVHAAIAALFALSRVVHGLDQLISQQATKQHLLRREEEATDDAPRTCSGDDCVQLMDDIHWNSKDARTVRNRPSKYDGLKSIRCEGGMASCELSYTFPDSNELLQANVHSSGARDFYRIAKEKGTDKVTTHHYETTYQEYLGNYSLPDALPFVMVEIGFAKGGSAKTWHEFLPKAKLHEFDVHCDEQWNVMDTSPAGIKGEHRDLGYCTLHCGDGTSATFLQESLKNDEAPFIVIDDGGHGPSEMKNTFEHMWPKLRAGGLFFIEDLAESYAPGLRMDAFVEKKVKPIVRDLLAPNGKNQLDVSSQVESIQCREQICALRKRGA